jgi:catechol-2,3-dioxygenase
MAFWNNWMNKPVTDPEKQLKKLEKYYREVLGLSKEEAKKKAREQLRIDKKT